MKFYIILFATIQKIQYICSQSDKKIFCVLAGLKLAFNFFPQFYLFKENCTGN